MRFSILHVSDLHRDPANELNNEWLIESLDRDLNKCAEQDPPILRPKLCIVSGDVVHGVRPDVPDATKELERQYAQAESFLTRVADQFFHGNRDRVVIVPGNHDISFPGLLPLLLKPL